MADDLKRVGLVFKEDGAVDFRKSLQMTNAQLRENYNQFKLTQAQWDGSTSKTTKLKAQLDYLNNAYHIQEQKVRTLRMQLNELESADQKDTLAIEEKRAELTKAETILQKYANQIKEVSRQLKITGEDITEFGENIQNVGGKIENAGKKVSAFSTATATAFVACAKTAIDFEDAFTGVEKTVNETANTSFADLKQGIRDMAKEIPATTTEISAVAEAAGQLGIETDNVLEFTRTMINMGNATNLPAEEAATTLARFANVAQMSQSDFDKLGSTIVALGNNFQTTEAEIAAMGMNLASAGTQVGMSQAEIMALATALSSVGLEAEAGGTAFSKVMVNMQLAVEKGGDKLKDFATVAGMSSQDFQKAFKEDATSAIMKFVEGLSKSDERGKSAIKVLDDMDIKETRLRDALLRSANASNVMSKAIELGNKAWEDNTALTDEANKRYENLKSKLVITVNKLKDIGITLGEKLMPYIEKGVEYIDKLVQKFNGLNDEQIETIIKIGAVVAALGPALIILGKIITAVGTVVKVIGTIKTAIEVMSGVVTTASMAAKGLAVVFGAITSPVGLAILAITAIVVAIKLLWDHCEGFRNAVIGIVEKIKETFSNAKDFIIDKLQKLSDFFSNLPETVSKMKEDIVNKFSELKDGVLRKISDFKDSIVNGFSKIKENILNVFSTVKESVVNVWDNIISAIKAKIETIGWTIAENFMYTFDSIKEIFSGIAEYFSGFWDLIKNIFGGAVLLICDLITGDFEQLKEDAITIWNNIKEAIHQILQGLQDIFWSTIDTIVTYIKECFYNIRFELIHIWMDIKENATNIWNSIKETLSNLVNNAKESVVSSFYTMKENVVNAWENLKINAIEKFNNIRDTIVNLPEQAKESAINTFHNLRESAVNIFENMKSALYEKISSIKETIVNGFQNAVSYITSLPGQALQWGRDIVQGIVNGINQKINDVKNVASNIASSIRSYLHFSEPDKGPLSDFHTYMPDMIKLMTKGINDNKNKLEKATADVAGKVADNLNPSNVNTSLRYVGSNVSSIDYNKLSTILTNSFLAALNKCKLTLDEDGFARIVKDELYKVV